MQKKVSTLLSLISIIAVGLLSGLSTGQDDLASGASGENGASQVQLQSLDSKAYHNLSTRIVNQYAEDMNFSVQVFTQYLDKNITKIEAVSGAAASYILTTRTLEDIMRVKPPEEYTTAYGYTIGLLTHLREFEWNMAKFYETNRTFYAAMAKDNLNTSDGYREELLKELELLEMTL